MFEEIVLGIVQGVAEWLPISSEGAIALIQINFFGGGEIENLIKFALFLHFGTFLAALVYLRKDVAAVLRTLVKYKAAENEQKKILQFLIVSFLISGLLGFCFMKVFVSLADKFTLAGQSITIVIGVLLLITAYLQLKARSREHKEIKELTFFDGILLGIVQGSAVLPGLSRSGLTVSILLLRKFGKKRALKLSFLMSLPIVLVGNIILNLEQFSMSWSSIVALAVSFLFGILTIHILFKIAKKINFGYFVLLFAILTLIAAFV